MSLHDPGTDEQRIAQGCVHLKDYHNGLVFGGYKDAKQFTHTYVGRIDNTVVIAEIIYNPYMESYTNRLLARVHIVYKDTNIKFNDMELDAIFNAYNSERLFSGFADYVKQFQASLRGKSEWVGSIEVQHTSSMTGATLSASTLSVSAQGVRVNLSEKSSDLTHPAHLADSNFDLLIAISTNRRAIGDSISIHNFTPLLSL